MATINITNNSIISKNKLCFLFNREGIFLFLFLFTKVLFFTNIHIYTGSLLDLFGY